MRRIDCLPNAARINFEQRDVKAPVLGFHPTQQDAHERQPALMRCAHPLEAHNHSGIAAGNVVI